MLKTVFVDAVDVFFMAPVIPTNLQLTVSLADSAAMFCWNFGHHTIEPLNLHWSQDSGVKRVHDLMVKSPCTSNRTPYHNLQRLGLAYGVRQMAVFTPFCCWFQTTHLVCCPCWIRGKNYDLRRLRQASSWTKPQRDPPETGLSPELVFPTSYWKLCLMI